MSGLSTAHRVALAALIEQASDATLAKLSSAAVALPGARALELGAMSAMMSGSGPTVFALTPEYRKAVAIFNGLKHQVEFAYITTFKEGY